MSQFLEKKLIKRGELNIFFKCSLCYQYVLRVKAQTAKKNKGGASWRKDIMFLFK